METVIFVLEIVGTLAFAASGALTGIKKNMDIFGVCILGLTTAVGGGIIRDLILGNTPPATFQNPVYAVLAVAASLIMFLPRLRRQLLRNKRVFEVMMFFMDTVGPGIFTVVGIRRFLCIFAGVCRRAYGRWRRYYERYNGGGYALYIRKAHLCLRFSGGCARLLGNVGAAWRGACRNRRSTLHYYNKDTFRSFQVELTQSS